MLKEQLVKLPRTLWLSLELQFIEVSFPFFGDSIFNLRIKFPVLLPCPSCMQPAVCLSGGWLCALLIGLVGLLATEVKTEIRTAKGLIKALP